MLYGGYGLALEDGMNKRFYIVLFLLISILISCIITPVNKTGENIDSDETYPEFIGEPEVIDINSSSFSVKFELNEDGNVYLSVKESGDPKPSLDEIKAEIKRSVSSNDSSIVIIGALNESTTYNVYLFAEDDSGNINDIVELEATTSSSAGGTSFNRDGNGWTEFTTSNDTRLIYISNEGSDVTGEFYLPDDIEIGTDPFIPQGAINTFATYETAQEYAREGYPDWILFKRGDEFYAQIDMKFGRSDTEVALVGSYGDSEALPVIYPVTPQDYAVYSFIRRNKNLLAYSALSSINFYSKTRDPSSPDYIDPSGSGGFLFMALGAGDERGIIRDILIEGCKFSYFDGNGFQAIDEGAVLGITLRRNVIFGNYSDGDGHNQGIFAGNVSGIVLEENIMDHNGWYEQSPGTLGTATMFNHNTYFADCHNITFKNNIFLRPSSMQNKFTANQGEASSTNIKITGNLYVGGEIGIGIGGNYDTPYKFKDIEIHDNVFTELGYFQPTNRTLGWGIAIADWDGGIVYNNFIIHNTNANVRNVYGIQVEGGSRNVDIYNNIVYDVKGRSFCAGSRDPDYRFNITVRNNIFHEIYSGDYNQTIYLAENEGISFSGNRYFSVIDNPFTDENGSYNYNEWISTIADNSTFENTDFPDTSRTIETYQVHIGETATKEAFIQACRNMDRFNWDTRYTADVVNAWLKAGFND